MQYFILLIRTCKQTQTIMQVMLTLQHLHLERKPISLRGGATMEVVESLELRIQEAFVLVIKQVSAKSNQAQQHQDS